ncbi:MAG: hypothetical protein A2513_04395 [Sulfurimonas sp. RIFOXYD12_FULL_33_39]|uniref:hypothetical protein n=1 Tax=unclassified Sulfurimonas TaxID=2623549 RepID=UPI0008C62730|nr:MULTISPECIES: hypothetical protein [unclassified Sulfurimonas]OHE09374.1 MAG: hypothetical protein A2513_04395 [Sulfurimonas sp. RIFOXYD12_FULL_33_39]OHE12844.1 MAG: hypothetical protein A2530_04410 [Sulfurimonas sp. RIFOXYD2_FULL_34_21]DAB27337.1 MAG TPA: hypothetical protein CFH78_08405 [Sulfurimonas sp. UBA10385]
MSKTIEQTDDGGLFGFLDTLYEDTTGLLNRVVDKIPDSAISDLFNKYTANTPEKVQDTTVAPKDSALSGTDFITNNKELVIGGLVGVVVLAILVKKL